MRFDFFPGAPDLACFPRALWLRTMREVFRSAPPSMLAYPDVRGVPALRGALAGHLRRVRGVVAEPSSILVCSGATQGLVLIGRALRRLGMETVAKWDPDLAPALRSAGHAVEEETAPRAAAWRWGRKNTPSFCTV